MYVLYHLDAEKFLQYCEELKEDCDNMSRHENSQGIPLGGTIWLCKFTFTFLLSPQSKHLFYALTYYHNLLLFFHNTARIFQHLNDTKHT